MSVIIETETGENKLLIGSYNTSEEINFIKDLGTGNLNSWIKEKYSRSYLLKNYIKICNGNSILQKTDWGEINLGKSKKFAQEELEKELALIPLTNK